MNWTMIQGYWIIIKLNWVMLQSYWSTIQIHCAIIQDNWNTIKTNWTMLQGNWNKLTNQLKKNYNATKKQLPTIFFKPINNTIMNWYQKAKQAAFVYHWHLAVYCFLNQVVPWRRHHTRERSFISNSVNFNSLCH